MMFDEAKARIAKEPKIYSFESYRGTLVGDRLEWIRGFNCPGDSYNVTYRELLDNGDVRVIKGLAGFEWLRRWAGHPGIEILEVYPTEQTLRRLLND